MTDLRIYMGNGILRGQGLPDINLLTDDSTFRPVSYPDLATARRELDAPTDANYVMWPAQGKDLWSVMKTLGPNDILVLPERDEPYWIDTSRGFMASGSDAVTGPDGVSWFPIEQEPGLFFEMCRVKRGILGLGPRAVVALSESSWTYGGRQPATGKFYRRRTDGTTALISNAGFGVLGCQTPNSFFANFTAQGKDFDGAAYAFLGISSQGNDNSHATVKRIHFDRAARGFLNQPHGESGALSFLNGTYTVENCDFNNEGSSSPIMWNRNVGGVARNVRSSEPDIGMWTFWKCGGVNLIENCWIDGYKVSFNLEQNGAEGIGAFDLDVVGGRLTVDSAVVGTRAHFNIFPSVEAPTRITVTDTETSPNAYTPGRTVLAVWGSSPDGTMKLSDVAAHGSTPALSCVPGRAWSA